MIHKDFTFKCTCYWSKNDYYGRITNLKCKVHGKDETKRMKKYFKIVDKAHKKSENKK